jgi:hypothetical protein
MTITMTSTQGVHTEEMSGERAVEAGVMTVDEGEVSEVGGDRTIEIGITSDFMIVGTPVEDVLVARYQDEAHLITIVVRGTISNSYWNGSRDSVSYSFLVCSSSQYCVR